MTYFRPSGLGIVFEGGSLQELQRRGVVSSGGGTNMTAVLDAAQAKAVPMAVVESAVADRDARLAANQPQCIEFLRKNPKVLQSAASAGVSAQDLIGACSTNPAGFSKAMSDAGLTAKWYTDKRVLIGGGVLGAILAVYLVTR